MLKRFFYLSVICLMSFSCKSQERFLAISDDFMTCVKNIDTVGFLKLMPQYIGKRSRIKDFYIRCKTISNLLKKYGVPEKQKFIVSNDDMFGKGYTFVTIPIFTGYDTVENLKNFYFTLRFYPDASNDGNHISSYELVMDEIKPHLVTLPVITFPRKKVN